MTKRRTGPAPARGAAGTRRSLDRPGRSVQAPTGHLGEPPAPRNGPALACGAAITLGCLALYVQTAARDIVVGDTPELMTVAVTFGVAHPPGYPLLTLLGHLFSLLPVGPIPFRVNLVASMCGAGTVAIVYATAWQLTRNWPAAAIASLALALHPLFWSWSLVFETFSLNNLLAASLVGLLALWETRGRDGYLVAGALVSGLALSNHLTIVLLGPAVLFLLWRHRDRLLGRPRVIGWCAGALLLGLLPYASIPWAAARHPYMSWGDVSSFSDLVALFLRSDYGTGNLVSNPEFAGGSPDARVLALAASFATIEGPLLVAGAIHAYRRMRWYFWFVATGFAFAGPVFVAYTNMNLSEQGAPWVLARFFLLSHVVVAPLTAVGMVALVEYIDRGPAGTRARLLRAAAIGGVLAALAVPAAMRYREIDQHDNHMASRYGRDVLDTVEPGTLLMLTGDEHAFTVGFVQAVEGHRPDVTVLLPPLMPGRWYVRLMKVRHPDLRLPDRGTGTLTVRDIVDANQHRPIAVVEPQVDKSLAGTYGVIQRGLVSLVKPLTQTFGLAEIAADNDALLRRYQPPSPRFIHAETFEPAILRSYAAPAEWVGGQYDKVGLHEKAAMWYRRALEIDPTFTRAGEALARVTAR